MQTLKINGIAKAASPPKGALKVHFREALDLILATEAATNFSDLIREELPAIVSHWLQSPKDSPILMSDSYGEKWVSVLRHYCEVRLHGPITMRPRQRKQPRPIYIDFSELPFPPTLKNPKFKFMDLFAGIGGFRIGLESLGGKCLFSSEWNNASKQTYFNNFGEVPFGDIKLLSSGKLIDKEIDILAGGFPCQPFSLAGVSARNARGSSHGFECEDQGQLFFDIIRMSKQYRPKILLLENVGNLYNHDGGRTFETIKAEIESTLGYKFFEAKYNCNTLVAQSRVRCIIVAFRDGPKNPDWKMPKLSGTPLPLTEILEKTKVDDRYTISDALWEGHKNRSRKNVERGVGFTAYERDLEKPAPTLVARYYKDGKECLIPQGEKNPRMLTERECARLQGFPAQFMPHPTRSNAYKQFGNSVPVPLIEFVAEHALQQV